MGCARAHFFLALSPGALGRGQKVKISLNIIKFQKYKTYQTGFSFGRLGHAPGVGLRGTVGGLGGQFFFFFEIQPDLVSELLT